MDTKLRLEVIGLAPFEGVGLYITYECLEGRPTLGTRLSARGGQWKIIRTSVFDPRICVEEIEQPKTPLLIGDELTSLA